MANYDLNSITHGNDTYNLKDNSKIPLSGTNALSGSIVPDTNNSYDLGDSSHNLKIVYAKEIRHGLSSGSLVCSGGDGTTNGANLVLYGTNRSDGFQGRFDLVAKGSSDYKLTGLSTGTLTWNGDIVDTIEEQGDGYIRYSNGLQICYGNVVNTNSIATGTSRHSYPVAFSAIPNVVATPNATSQAGPHLVTVIAESETNFIVNLWWTQASQLSSSAIKSHYVAIGKWK